MSSTSNAQDLLVNVFRPTYRWDSNTGFVPSLVVSNVTEVITGNLKADKLVVSDSNLNTYIGCNAGVNASNTASNVALGYSAMGGSLTSSNNVAIGMFSLDGLSNSDSNVALGASTDINGRGRRNVLIGPNVTMGDGSGNILIGADISVGNVTNRFQLGRLLYADLCSGFLGVNMTDPTTAFDVSGITIFRDKVGIQMSPSNSLDVNGSIAATERFYGGNATSNAPLYSFILSPTSGMYVPTDASYGPGAVGIAVRGMNRFVVASNRTYVYNGLDVCGTIISSGGSASFLAEKGKALLPAYSFSADTSLGFYYTTDPSGTALGIAVGGQQRMVLGSNKMTLYGNLDVCGAFSAVSGGGGGGGGGTVGSNGTAALPSFTFTNDLTTGMYLQSVSNLGFSSGGVRRMGILDTGDVSAGQLVVSQYLRDVTNGARTLDISGGNISNAGVHTTAGLVGSYLRNALIPTTYDISGGNISNSGTTQSTNALVSGYLRNALVPTTWDISGGNISNSGLTISSNMRVVNGSLGAPAYTFTSDPTTGIYASTTGQLDFTVQGNRLMNLGSVYGGVNTYLGLNALGTSPQIRLNGTSASNQLAFHTSNSIILVGNQVGSGTPDGQFGVSLDNGGLSAFTVASSGVIVPGHVRNALTPTTWDISGGNISNSGTTRSSNFIAPGYLRNALTPTTWDISGGNISNSGTTISSNFSGTATASNQIGGVTLNARQVNVEVQASSDTFLVTAADSTVASLLYSTDGGSTWSPSPTTVFSVVAYNVAWNGAIWVAAGNGATNSLAYSYDGIRWTGLGKTIFSGGCRSVCWGNGLFVGVGNGGNTIAVSQDGINWTGLGNIIFSTGGNSVAYGGGYFVTAGDGGANSLAWSVNGIAWTGLGKTYFTDYGTHVAHNGTYWCAVGTGTNSDAVYTATDPTGVWTKRTMTGGVFGWSIAWNGTTWMVGTQGNPNIFTSTNGTSWTGTYTAALGTVYGLGWSGTAWIAGTSGTARVATSTDNGATWTPRLTSAVVTGTGQFPASRRYVLPVTNGVANSPTYTPIDISDGYIRVPSTVQSANFRAGKGAPAFPSYSFSNDQVTGMYLRNTSIIEFATAGVARMCISGASVGIGVTAPAYTLHLGTDSAAKPTTSTWTVSSDRRIKQNIERADTSLCYNTIKRLPLQRFTWDASYMPNVPDKKSVGWIAQDVREVFPNAVSILPNAGFSDFHSLDVDQIYKTLYGALEKVIADKESLELDFAIQKTCLSNVMTRLATLEASQQSSESTPTTPPTPPPPSESPESSPAPPPPPSSEYAPAPAETEA